MYTNNKLKIAKNDNTELNIVSKMLNRHGIITGATGTGKTVTVKVLAETLSAAGIPCFVAEVKGDLSSLAFPGDKESLQERLDNLKIEDFKTEQFPVRFWDIYGKTGHPIKARIDSFTPSLLTKILNLTEAQNGMLNIAYRIAKDESIPMINFQDLKTILKHVNENKDKYSANYGNITTQSIGTIERKLLEFENNNGDVFFGNPEIKLEDLIRTDLSGKGYINILDATELVKDNRLYGTYMLWLLNTLFDKMPEVGDLEKPRLVFFIDEAHMLFDEMNSEMKNKITQIVKLIRSKGIGLFFISQNPSDIPEVISTQLGNRIQHNLKAYTPNELKSVKVAAQSFRVNPNFDTEKVISELKTGEALVSFMSESGEPSIVERAFILPPQSRFGTITDLERQNIVLNSDLYMYYSQKSTDKTAAEVLNQTSTSTDPTGYVNQTELFLQQQKEKELAKQQNASTTKTTKKTTTKKSSLERKVENKIENKIATKIVNSIFKMFK